MHSHTLKAASALILAWALAACGGSDGSAADPTELLTAEGRLVGTQGAGHVSYRGIPYAEQPVGALRWAPTVPPAARSSVLQATQWGPSCPQAGPGADAATAEACLYLNVWKPTDAKPGSQLPVVVFMHGGAFVLGSGAQVSLTELTQRQVVSVSFNYRLGALGYMANSALQASSKEGSLGNFALMDAMAALTWVQKNIAAFGGDASNVTLWGLSAGATQTFSLLQSPQAKGLFHKAILQSGGGAEFSNLAPQAALAVGDAAVATLGCARAADQAACLRALPVSQVLAAQGPGKWRPTVDGQVLTQVPARAFEAGSFNRVPVMVGGVFDEGTLFSDPQLTATNYPLYLRSLVPAGFDTTQIDATYALSRFAVPGQGYARAVGDAMYACGNSARRDALSAWVPVYGWEFTDPAMSFPEQPTAYYYGSSHGLDSLYLTGNADALPAYPFLDASSKAAVTSSAGLAQRKALAAQMLGYVVNFAKGSDPNGDGRSTALHWPRFAGPKDRQLMEFTLPDSRVSNTRFEQVHHCGTVWPAIY